MTFAVASRARGADAHPNSTAGGLQPGSGVIARIGEWIWETFGLRGEPPATRMAVPLFGEQVTVNDAKARRELGYVGKVTREQGLASLVSSRA